MFWNLRLLIIIFINNILIILTCIPLDEFILFICLLMNAIKCLLNLLDAFLWVILFFTKVMLVMIHALKDFVYLIVLFSLKINISFPFILHLHLRYMFFHTLMTCLLLLNCLSLDLCIDNDTQPCLFLSLSRHLSLFRQCLLWLSRIPTLVLIVLLLLIGMDFLLHSFMLLCHPFRFLHVILRQLSMNVDARQW